jgi:hypothetical protein
MLGLGGSEGPGQASAGFDKGKTLSSPGGFGDNFMRGLATSQKMYNKLSLELASAQGEDEKKIIQSKMDELVKSKNAKWGATVGQLSDKQKSTALGMVSGPSQGMAQDIKKLMDEMGMSFDKAWEKVTTGKDTSDLSTELMGKALWSMDPKPLEDLAKKGIHPGSIYTHDIHAEKHLKDMALDDEPAVLGSQAMVPQASKVDEDMADNTDGMSDNLGKIYNALRNRGIRIEKFVGDHVRDTMHDAVLSAANEALFDYYMYQGTDKGSLAKALKAGVSPTSLVGGMMGGMKSTGTMAGATDAVSQMTDAAAKASASISSGSTEQSKTNTQPGGTQKIELSLKGDLARIIDARADDRYAVNRSREKFR